MTTVTHPAGEALALAEPTHFAYRHIGPRQSDVEAMLDTLGYDSLDTLIDAVVPGDIRLRRPLALPPGRSEREVLQALRAMAAQNQVFRSYIGMGYSGTFTPPVILRNVLENPGWYTAYTPYQAEIAQGRLEALVNFQTVVADLTGLSVAAASLLDEATAAAEAMQMTVAVTGRPPEGPSDEVVEKVELKEGAGWDYELYDDGKEGVKRMVEEKGYPFVDVENLSLVTVDRGSGVAVASYTVQAGPRATELVAEAVLMLRMECTIEELVKTIHAHPTMSEAVGEAAHAAHGAAIHI
jgi:hypothetical protein